MVCVLGQIGPGYRRFSGPHAGTNTFKVSSNRVEPAVSEGRTRTLQTPARTCVLGRSSLGYRRFPGTCVRSECNVDLVESDKSGGQREVNTHQIDPHNSTRPNAKQSGVSAVFPEPALAGDATVSCSYPGPLSALVGLPWVAVRLECLTEEFPLFPALSLGGTTAASARRVCQPGGAVTSWSQGGHKRPVSG